ncbi:hypothetical protein PG994_001661 [Apiospora phragmitis]|uniref:Uncharacterized protein n=1 Tax=Apiospora phragmitis TaxID=2905665 RepID=A0ABR1WUA6_9PEZI
MDIPPPIPPRPPGYEIYTPTPLFEALMAAFFGRLDPGRAGHIKPETLSGFLDLNGFLTEDNIWKSNLKGGNFLYTAEDLADYELKACCEAWCFDHKTMVRHPGRNQIPYGGMPLLSLQGLTDMMAVESAGEPERGWRSLNAALQHYGIWPAMGPLPREVFLQDMPRQLQQRLEQVKIRNHRAAQERLDAVRVQGQIAAQGRQVSCVLPSLPRQTEDHFCVSTNASSSSLRPVQNFTPECGHIQ